MAVDRTYLEQQWLNTIRSIEFDALGDILPEQKETAILEIGSGTGYLLNKMGNLYNSVVGIEVESSAYNLNDSRIQVYDGINIPFPDNSFDIIFSCHVIEHVECLNLLSCEMKRVLKENGTIIHIAPSSTWRILTTIFHYAHICSLPFRILVKNEKSIIQRSTKNFPNIWNKIAYILLAPRHGQTGNRITEVFYFSKNYWINLFKKQGFTNIKVIESGIAYWGHDITKSIISIKYRKIISKIIGSSSNIFIMKK
jgi:ubiquinone/menaquinone biosynthesis C-methylase UbiE